MGERHLKEGMHICKPVSNTTRVVVSNSCQQVQTSGVSLTSEWMSCSTGKLLNQKVKNLVVGDLNCIKELQKSVCLNFSKYKGV